jgi:FkbM family methyltransferase
LYDYLKHDDWTSVFASVKYILNKKSHASDRVIKTSIGTFFCRKNTNDFQFANLYYEWGVRKFILNHIDEFSVFIDGGACIGDYCIWLGIKEKRCFAFELVKDNIQVLKKNIELNNLQNTVTIYPYGLGESDYTASYNFNPVNTGASRINKVRAIEDKSAKVKKLDSLIDEMKIGCNEPIFFKLDVEGMESEAIKGATKFLTEYTNVTLIIEEKHSGIMQIQDTLSDIAIFEFGEIDKYNIYVKKIKNYS